MARPGRPGRRRVRAVAAGAAALAGLVVLPLLAVATSIGLTPTPAAGADPGGDTRMAWAEAFVTSLDAPSPDAVRFALAWATEEGAAAEANNPLDSTLAEPGSTPSCRETPTASGCTPTWRPVWRPTSPPSRAPTPRSATGPSSTRCAGPTCRPRPPPCRGPAGASTRTGRSDTNAPATAPPSCRWPTRMPTPRLSPWPVRSGPARRPSPRRRRGIRPARPL